MSDRTAISWHAQIRALRLSCWVAEENGKPVEVRIVGGGPLSLTLADFCEALSIGLAKGVPVDVYTRTLRGRVDELGGPVDGDPLVSECGSLGDYVARALDARYGPEAVEAFAKREEQGT